MIFPLTTDIAKQEKITDKVKNLINFSLHAKKKILKSLLFHAHIFHQHNITISKTA